MAVQGRASESEFDIKEARGAGREALVLSGELDMATASGLESRVADLCADGADEIVMDLSNLSFMDSSGLHAMLAVQSICRDYGVELMLTPPTGAVRRLFVLTGMFDVLPVTGVAGDQA